MKTEETYLDEISDRLFDLLKQYITPPARYREFVDNYRGVDIIKYTTSDGTPLFLIPISERSTEDWVEFDDTDLERAYEWIDIYMDKGREEADKFWDSLYSQSNNEELREEKNPVLNNIDDDRVFDWTTFDSNSFQKDAKDIEDYIIHNSDIIPDQVDFQGIEIVVGVHPATRWQPEEEITKEIDYTYDVTDYEKESVLEEIWLTYIEKNFNDKKFTGREIKDFLKNSIDKDFSKDYILNHFEENARNSAQDWYDNRDDSDYLYDRYADEVAERESLRASKEEKKEEKKMNLKEYLESFDDAVDEEVEKIVDVFDVSYTIGDGPYQSIMVKADDPEEAAVKVKKQIKGAEIVGVAAQLDPKGMMERGKPILEEITDDVSVRDWYIKAFPNDELGYEIDDYIKFEDIQKALDDGEPDVYDVIGVADSIIRERIFSKLADLTGVSYDDIYEKWINAGAAQSEKNTNWYNPEEDDDL